MAGSGKTALMQRLNSHLHMQKIPGYILNLDPAVLDVPYGANIDIRDTVHAPSKLVALTLCCCLSLRLDAPIDASKSSIQALPTCRQFFWEDIMHPTVIWVT